MRGKTPLVLLVLLVTLVGGFGVYTVEQQLQGLDPADPAALNRLLDTLTLVGGSMVLVLLGAAGWFWRLSQRIRHSGQFPPPAMLLLRPVPLRTGPTARWLALASTGCALLLALLALVFGVMLWELLHTLRGG